MLSNEKFMELELTSLGVKTKETPKTKDLGEAGIDVDIIDYIFSGEHGDSIDQDEFREWY